MHLQEHFLPPIHVYSPFHTKLMYTYLTSSLLSLAAAHHIYMLPEELLGQPEREPSLPPWSVPQCKIAHLLKFPHATMFEFGMQLKLCCSLTCWRVGPAGLRDQGLPSSHAMGGEIFHAAGNLVEWASSSCSLNPCCWVSGIYVLCTFA
jgi:hypothetical protein